MIKIAITYSLFSVSLLLFSAPVYAEEDICGSQDGFGIYECRVKNVCEKYKSPKPVYNSQDYENAESQSPEFQWSQSMTMELDAVKKLYRENMGNIYKCAIIQSQINTLENLVEFIAQESSGRLSDNVGGQLSLRINRLEISASTIGCTLADDESIQNKLNLLYETTYQACKHVSYLEYLKSYYKKTETLFTQQERINNYGNDYLFSFSPQKIANDINARTNLVAEEISHTYEIFPIAYHAYSEYENNFPIHFLLEIIRADFMLLSDNLKDNLMPIAQLWLKIINAQSK